MFRLAPMAVLVILSTGCADRFSIHQRSCNENFTRWEGGLTSHLLRGQRAQGTFSYDPPGKVKTHVEGMYDLITGDFEWDVDFPSEHWRVDQEVEGYGYARTNGDLDIEYEVITLDVLDNQWSVDVREARVGCEARKITTDNQGNVTDERGAFVSGAYVYEVDNGNPDVSIDGTRYSDGTWREDYSLDGDYEHDSLTEGDADGYSIDTFTQVTSSATFEGTIERFIDGTVHTQYSFDGANGSGEWDYTRDYAGDGEGTFDDGDEQCDVTFEDDECTLSCSDGDRDC